MADPRFYSSQGPFSLEQLASIAEARIEGASGADAVFSDVRPLSIAGAGDVSFLDNPRYVSAFSESKAGACLVHPEHTARAPDGMVLLVTEEPYRAYARVAAAFYPMAPVEPGISKNAQIDKTVKLGAGVRIEANAVIGSGVILGDGTGVGAGAVIGPNVTIGGDCRIGANVVLDKCVIGDRVIIYPGVAIGQDGFGFAPGAGGHLKVPQLGLVLIESDVEIGANCTIDRGAGPDTVIGQGTKIDNLVQIGHNVTIGCGCLIAGQAGISGTTKIGDFVMIGGQSGFAGHIDVGNGVRVAGQSGVTRDIEPGVTIAGMPAMPAREHWRQLAVLAKLTRRESGKKED